jgi:hypothetical protein
MKGFFLNINLLVLAIYGFSSSGCEPTPYISGVVIDEIGPVASATVRIQATTNATLTDSNGRFLLTGISVGESVTVSAWKDGYYCAKVDNRSRRLISPPATDVSLTLRLYQTYDNPDYTWMPPTGEKSCASCKLAVTEVWLNNAHAGSANNSRFLSMYNGTDVNGNQSGPGFKIDYPDSAGICAACHIPGAAVDDPNGIDPNEVTGPDTFGIHCDYCHKVADVYLDDSSGLPYKDMPGVLSSDIRRPFPDDPERYQLFFGTFDDDNVPEEDTYLPLIEESQFCAPCHFGNVFGDTIVYNSFGEWLESSYSDPETGMTCQDCHMPSPTIYNGEPLTNVAPRKGGIERDPLTIHAHLQLGAMDSEFLQNAVTMEVDATREDDTVTVNVSITNDNTGHHIPTDSPLRHMILLVQAKDESGEELLPLDGPIVPEWVGEGNPDERYYAGLPGKAYAKVLQEMRTGVIPSGAYWNKTQIVSDNRIAAFASDNSTYTFRTPENGTTGVTVTLLFRRAFIELMDQKGWNTPDIIMAQESISIGDGD